MEPQRPAVPASPFARLREAFGDELAIERSARTVCWSFDGCAAVATMRQDGFVEASFLDRRSADCATGDATEAVYAPHAVRYRLDAAGSTRMVEDVAAFFSGAREPRFTFVSLREPRRTL